MKHRGIAMSRKGMVSSAHTLISSSGLNILKQGGNAIDAAIAMANTSGVVLPDMCGLGGDAFLLYFEASTQKIYCINGSGIVPHKASLNYFKEKNMETIPNDGILSVSVPGQVDALFLALEKFGTMSFDELSKDAIDLAENGCPISEKVARHIRTNMDKIINSKELSHMFLDKDGNPKNPGDIYTNPDYAQSLKLIGSEGRNVFYKGDITKKIVNYSKKKNGLLELDDFKEIQASFENPIHVNYRDYTVWQTPPVSQGIIHLEELNILNQFDLSQYKSNSAEVIHLMVEAKKRSFADRNNFFGDPKFIDNPIKKILSQEYAKQCAKDIDLNKTKNIEDIIPYNENGHTTSFVVIDQFGNAVSFIHSIANTWGSGEVVEGTGILLNNRAGGGFNLIPNHPNCIAPGKRTMHTLITYMITDKDGCLKWFGNTPGGDNQPQWNMQVVCNIIDFKMDIQSAVEAPRWSDIQTTNISTGIENILKIENTVGDEILEKLKQKGHKLKVTEPYSCSGASQIIEIRENGIYFGGSDPRADGCAIGI